MINASRVGLVSNLRGCRSPLEIRLAIPSFRDQTRIRARVAPQDACREHQRFRQHLRVLERQVVEHGVALTPELFDDVHLIGVEVPAATAPDP